MKETDDVMMTMNSQVEAVLRQHPKPLTDSADAYRENHAMFVAAIAAIRVPAGYQLNVAPLSEMDIRCRLPFTVSIGKL